MLPRFWIDRPLTLGTHELGESEAHHARNVLRMNVGEAVEAFDGRGLCGTGTLQRVDKKQVVVQIEALQATPLVEPKIILATAVPKGERMDWLVEKATELGVSRLIPLKTTRSSVDPRDSKLDRLRLQVVAACKQSRRNDLMEIAAVTSWADFLSSIPQTTPFYVAQPGGRNLSLNRVETADLPAGIVIAIGPEGGWTDEELATASHLGAQPISLGPYILRIETAALAAVVHVSGLRQG